MDGETHNNIVSENYDEKRTAYLNSLGIKVVRFENKEIFEDMERVLAEIKTYFTTPANAQAIYHTPSLKKGGEWHLIL